MKHFSGPGEVAPITREREHDGVGAISFRRLLSEGDFAGPIDFVDFTIIPPGSTIGLHEHRFNEEVYFIASGSPLIEVAGDKRRLKRGDVAVVHSGENHSLLNDTEENVEIFVIQVTLKES